MQHKIIDCRKQASSQGKPKNVYYPFCDQLARTSGILKLVEEHTKEIVMDEFDNRKMLLGIDFPNFAAKTTDGEINFYDWLGNSWGILFSHPSDFTPVCTTELARVLQLMPEFNKRKVKVIGLSCDTIYSHQEWCRDISNYAAVAEFITFPYPIIEDYDRAIATRLCMIEKDQVDHHGIPVTARAVYILDPRKKLRLSITYPATTGRNFDEVLRVLDSMQLTDKAKIATPADWKMGDDCMVLPTVADDELDELFPQGVTVVPVPSGKNYIRKTPCPKPLSSSPNPQ